MTPPQQELDRLATQLFLKLEQTGDVLVLAESCTAGLVAATLARVPGMSRRLAGSFVVYQIDSKVAWLGVSADTIQHHGVVSREVADAMALKALERTPHATIAMSITGHLGPDAPAALDGVAWLAIAWRGQQAMTSQLELNSDSGSTSNTTDDPSRIRHARQSDAVLQAISRLLQVVLSPGRLG
ncbi:MAG: CinA family protein [Fuerstia sp.]|nr:CinA family protein [Fuerstiella sp.]